MGKENFIECQEYLIILSLISNMEMARVKFDRFNFTSQVGLYYGRLFYIACQFRVCILNYRNDVFSLYELDISPCKNTRQEC